MDPYSNRGTPGPTLQQLHTLVEARARTSAGKLPEHEQSHRLKRRLDPCAIRQIVKAYEAGATTPELCKRHGISKGGILRLLRENDATMRRQKLTDEQGAEAVKLYSEGLAMARVAERLDTSYGNVRTHLIEMGIERRPRGGSHGRS